MLQISFGVDCLNTITCNLVGASDNWLDLHGGLQHIFEMYEAVLMITRGFTVALYKKFGENKVSMQHVI